MPQPYRTYEELEAEITRPRSYGGTAEGTATAPDAVSEVKTTAGIPVAATQPTPATTTTTSEAPGRVQDLSIRDYAGPDVSEEYRNLFAPITKQREEATSKLRNLSTTFQEEAGPSRTWESIHGANQISAALAPDTDTSKDEAEMEAVRGLLQASYEGPTELKGTDELTGTISGLQDTRRALRGSSGLEALLQYRSPTPATEDELQMEAGRLLADRAYLESARAASGGIEDLAAQLSAAQRGAQALSEQRAAEEAGIASAAREQLTGIRTGIDEELARRIAKKEARDKAVEEVFGTYQDTGNLASLEAYAPGIQETFNIPAVQALTEGKAKLADIGKKYASIADIPLLTPQITTHGRSQLGWSEEEWNDLKKRYPDKAEREQIRNLALQRQEEIATSGFDPSVLTHHAVEGGKYKIGSNEMNPEAAGEYSTVLPMIYGGDLAAFEPINPQPYINLEQGTGATRENISTPEQRETYNRASDLLGMATELSAAETPYEKSRISNQIDKYLADTEAVLSARRETLTENEKNFMQQVHQARKKYKNDHNTFWRGAKDIATMGFNEVLPSNLSQIMIKLGSGGAFALGIPGAGKGEGKRKNR